MSVDDGSEETSAREKLRARTRRLEVAVVVLGVTVLSLSGWTVLRETSSRHEVLTVERLEVVEPDGQPAFVLANSERPARGTFGGEVLMEGRTGQRSMPNFVFYDGHGDEVGGMLFENEETGDGFYASRHLSLDGYRQDQTVQLFHQQTPDGASSGLRINDRPEDRSLRETFEGLGLEVPFTPEELDSALAAELPEEGRAERMRELFGVNRILLGSSGTDEATLVLRDGEQRPRIVLGVPEEGEPYLRVLDEAGEPVAELP